MLFYLNYVLFESRHLRFRFLHFWTVNVHAAESYVTEFRKLIKSTMLIELAKSIKQDTNGFKLKIATAPNWAS